MCSLIELNKLLQLLHLCNRMCTISHCEEVKLSWYKVFLHVTLLPIFLLATVFLWNNRNLPHWQKHLVSQSVNSSGCWSNDVILTVADFAKYLLMNYLEILLVKVCHSQIHIDVLSIFNDSCNPWTRWFMYDLVLNMWSNRQIISVLCTVQTSVITCNCDEIMPDPEPDK